MAARKPSAIILAVGVAGISSDGPPLFFRSYARHCGQTRMGATAKKQYRIAIVETTGSVQNVARPMSGNFGPFFQELARGGFIEGKNLLVERYSAEGRLDRSAELAREVVAKNPDIILPASNGLVLRFKAATTTIPIIMRGANPIAAGIVDNLARPEGNITGVSFDPGDEYYAKLVEYLRLAVPGASRIAYLISRRMWQSDPITKKLHEAADRIGVTLIPALIDDSPIDEAAIRRALAQATHEHVDGLIVAPAPTIHEYSQMIAEWTRENGIPAICGCEDFAHQGGLMSYRADIREVFLHLAKQVGMVLRGTKPGDIPIYQPNKFYFRVNLATARTLGIEIPPMLLARADEVFE